MARYVAIGEAAKERGVSITTSRRYDLSTLRPEAIHRAPLSRKTVAYARVSSYDQKGDLERQR